MGIPMAVTEYGWPDNGFEHMPAWTLDSERLYARLLDRYGLSCFRIWYAYTGRWGVLHEDGSEEVEKFDILARPYPRRIAGTAKNWSFDLDSKAFHLEIEPESNSQAPNEIFIPVRRHYPKGFTLGVNGDAFASDHTAPRGLRPKGNTEKIPLFDFDNQILSVAGARDRLTLSVEPG